ncbi:hypothetical protein ABZP36_014949 [Zizania latifolia]
MSQERALDEVVSPFLMQLSKARLHFLKLDKGSSFLEIKHLFQNIEKEAHEVENILKRVSRWENEIINDFGGIARHLDDIVEEESHLPSICSKLQIVGTEMSDLKDRMKLPLHVPVIKPSVPTLLSSSSPSRVLGNASERWKKLEIERKILENSTMSNLQLSYDNLDLQLKLCLLCFSIFPENSIISKRAMIHWWIGEGLVAATRSHTAEDIGKDCFDKLIAREMIEPVHVKRRRNVSQCKVHPWIRRMLITVARNAQFFEFDSEGNATWDNSGTHRACLVEEYKQEIETAPFIRNQPNTHDLLTIFNVNERYIQFDKSWLLDLRKIAVLQLGRWHNLHRHHIEVDSIEVDTILQLSKQLKYLCLRGISRITDLPASIGELSNLMILDLHACHNLERLTESITSLQMLTHLDVSECYLLEGMPRGIGLLTELQVLKGFVIGGSTSNSSCRVVELVKLEKLKKLSIYIGNKVAVTGDELNELENIKGLHALTITWAVLLLKKGEDQRASAATAMLTSLFLPPNLEKLDLRCFPGEKMPSWLSPSKLLRLKKLYFTGGMLNTFGDGNMSEVWKVEILRLKFLNDLVVEWTQVHKTFPNLTFLEVFRCSKLESFPCDKDGVWMRTEK